MIDVFLVHDDVDRASTIRQAIGTDPELALVSETQTGREALFAVQTIQQGHPRMAIVRLNLGDMNGFDFINQVRQRSPDIYIIPALEGNEGGQVWASLLQLELKDVIMGAVPASEIARVLKSASGQAQKKFDETRAQVSTSDAFVISVVSARGGVGKSVIATNLAAAMARQNEGVSLLDFSLNSGDFVVMLDDVPRNHIMDAVAAGGGMDADLLQNLLAVHPRFGFRYLAYPNQEFDSTPFDYNIALAMLQSLRGICPYLVVDTGMAAGGPTIAAVDSSDIVFLVTSRDVVRLLAAQRYIKYLKNDRGVTTQKLKVLVNEAEIGGEISDQEVESVIEHPVTAYLPSNPHQVTFSINSGTPVVIGDPSQPVSVVLAKLAELSLNRWQELPEEEDSKMSKLSGKIGAKVSQKLNLR